VLGNVSCGEVVFQLSSPNRAGIVVPHEDADDTPGEDILMLIMPVMLNTYA
jgi:DNA polymerase-3 subunit beta